MASTVESPRVAQAISVLELLKPLAPWLGRGGVSEVCINRPGELFFEDEEGWQASSCSALSAAWSQALAVAVARLNGKEVGRDQPFLSAALPRGERVQVVIPPAVRSGCISITIRCPSTRPMTVQDLADRGLFGSGRTMGRSSALEQNARLRELLSSGKRREFLQTALRGNKNIAFVGVTGCGKTTLMKALCTTIDRRERIITIEDTHELVLGHPNHVALGFDEAMGVRATDCLKSTLRMRPDRVILSELRGAEAFDFINLLLSGHGGSMTSFHAQSATCARQRLVVLAKSHGDAAGIPVEVLERMVRMTVDVVVHLETTPQGRRIGEIVFDPFEEEDWASRSVSIPPEQCCLGG